MQESFADLSQRIQEAFGKIPEGDFALLTSGTLTETLLERLGESAVLIINKHARIIYISERAEQLLHASHENLLNKDYFESIIVHDEKDAEIPTRKQPAWEALHTANYKRITPFFCYYHSKEPNARLQIAVKALAIEKEGKVVGAIITLREVKRVLNVDEMKSLFVSFAAHQLKTPSSITKGFLELLVREGENSYKKSQWQNLQSAYEANEALINLSKALLNLTKLEGGLIEPRMSTIHPKQILEDKILAKNLLCKVKNITVALETHGTRDHFVTDEVIFSELFDILFSNAIKFSPQDGTITVDLTVNENGLWLSVTDQGPGISQEKQSELFITTFKSDPASAGHGIGLVMAKKYLAILKGDIEVNSAPGQGSTFILHIPKTLD